MMRSIRDGPRQLKLDGILMNLVFVVQNLLCLYMGCTDFQTKNRDHEYMKI